MENQNQQPVAVKGPQVYKLLSPVQWGQETITEIAIPKLKGKHIKGIKKDSGLSDILLVAAKASGHPMAMFDEMDSQDVLNIAELVGNLL